MRSCTLNFTVRFLHYIMLPLLDPVFIAMIFVISWIVYQCALLSLNESTSKIRDRVRYSVSILTVENSFMQVILLNDDSHKRLVC